MILLGQDQSKHREFAFRPEIIRSLEIVWLMSARLSEKPRYALPCL